MAIVALTWALVSVEDRRQRDPIMAKLDSQGRIETVTASIERIAGAGPEACAGKPLWDLALPDDRSIVERAFRQAVAQPPDAVALECRFLNADGSPRGVKLRIESALNVPTVKGVVVNLQEITDVPPTTPDRMQVSNPAPRRLPLLVLVTIGILVYALAGGLVMLAAWIYRLGKRLGSEPGNRPRIWLTIGCLAAACLGDLWLMHFSMSKLAERPPPPPALALPAVTPAKPAAPAELEALGYLPPRTNVIAAIHVAEALQTPPGKEFLERFRLGRWGMTPADLEKWTSFKPEDIDHFAVGATVDGSGFQLVMVVKTRRPYDPAKVRTTINTSSSSQKYGKKYYEFSRRAPFGVVWFPPQSNDLLVITMSPDNLKEVPELPRSGKDRVPPPVGDLLTDRLGKVAQFWLAINLKEFKTLDLKVLGVPREYREIIDKFEQGALAIRLNFGLEIHAAMQCADDKSAEALAAKWLAGAPQKLEALLNLLGPLQGFQPLLQEMAQSLQHDQKGRWLTIKSGARLETLQKALQQKSGDSNNR